MKNIVIFSGFLLVGLILSQLLPMLIPAHSYEGFSHTIRMLTTVALGFIMIRVGYEFNIDKNRLKAYGWDYVVAATAATFPWLFVAIYFVFILSDTNVINVWKESLLVSRFAAPTSAGVLFSMLAGAGLGLTWMYKKIKILAIFDDLDTVLLLIPLKMLMVGWKWQLGVVLPHVFSFMGCMALLAQVAHPNHMALGDKLQCGDYFDFRGNLLFKQADRRSCTNSY